MVVEAFDCAEGGLVSVADVEVDGAAVSFMVPFTDIVVTNGVADWPYEVLVDESFRIMPEIMFTDFVFSPEKNRFDMSRDTANELVTECLDRASSHIY